MRIIAATFEDTRDAYDALQALRSGLELPADAVDVRPLGSTEYDSKPDADTILAARFEKESAPTVARLVQEHRGQVVVERDEAPY